MLEDVLIPLGLFGIILGIVWVVQSHGYRTRKSVQETIQEAIKAGQNLTPETIRAIGTKPRPKGGDLRVGVIWLSVALAFIALGASIQVMLPADELDDMGPFLPMLGVAAFPGFVGLALIILHFVLGDKD